MRKDRQVTRNRFKRYALVFCMAAGTLLYAGKVNADPLLREAPIDSLQKGNIIIGVEGLDTTSAQQAMLDEINQVRKRACDEGDPDPRNTSRKLTSADYVPIKLGESCTRTAVIRAAEGAVKMSHARPNGYDCLSVLQYFQSDTYTGSAENLAWYPQSGSSMEGWIGEREDYLKDPTGKSGKVIGHYTNLINPDHRFMGVAAFNPTNDSAPYNWTCTAGSYTGKDTELTPSAQQQNQTVIQKMEVPAEAVTEKAITGVDAMTKGQEKKLLLEVSVYFTGVSDPNTTRNCPVYEGITWTSENPDIISIDSEGCITAKSVGKSKITASIGSGENVQSVSRELHVLDENVEISSVANPETITVESTKTPALPKTLTATLSDGLTMEVDVTWDAYDTGKLTTFLKSTEFDITGKAAGFEVKQKIHVNAARMTGTYTKPAEVTTDYGVEPEYPLAWVGMSNGYAYKELKVTWDEESKGYYLNEKGGTFTIRGVTEFGFTTDTGTIHYPVTATLIVNPKPAVMPAKEDTAANPDTATNPDTAANPGTAKTQNEGQGEKTASQAEADPEDDFDAEDCEEDEVILSDQGVKVMYEIESDTRSSRTVTFEKAATRAATVKVPDTVTIQGKKYKVTAIDDNAFKNHKTVREIVIGKNIRRIGKRAFSGCEKLRTITIKSRKLTAKKIKKNAFKGIGRKVKIKVPKGKKKAYTKLFRSKGLSKKVKVTN